MNRTNRDKGFTIGDVSHCLYRAVLIDLRSHQDSVTLKGMLFPCQPYVLI